MAKVKNLMKKSGMAPSAIRNKNAVVKGKAPKKTYAPTARIAKGGTSGAKQTKVGRQGLVVAGQGAGNRAVNNFENKAAKEKMEPNYRHVQHKSLLGS